MYKGTQALYTGEIIYVQRYIDDFPSVHSYVHAIDNLVHFVEYYDFVFNKYFTRIQNSKL